MSCSVLPHLLYFWAWQYKAWNLSLARLDPLPACGFSHHLCTLNVIIGMWGTEKALMLCKHCSATTKILVCCQCDFGQKSQAAPNKQLWRTLTPTQTDPTHEPFPAWGGICHSDPELYIYKSHLAAGNSGAHSGELSCLGETSRRVEEIKRGAS